MELELDAYCAVLYSAVPYSTVQYSTQLNTLRRVVGDPREG